MKKSIYSLVLADEVVAAADRLAAELHTSRSNLINQILAERLSCITPEMRMQAVFSRMGALSDQFRLPEQTSAHILALHSRLDYKYKPTVQYIVELHRIPQHGEVGVLHVRLRTQNAALLRMLEEFFLLWMALEERYLPETCGCCRPSAGRLDRILRDPGTDEEQLGECIGTYIRFFDRYLKAWFAGITYPQETAIRLEQAFREEAACIRI